MLLRGAPPPGYREALGQFWVRVDDADDAVAWSSCRPSGSEWAVLRYFRTLVDSPAASDAPYLMAQVLVEQLVPLGVRYLVDHSSRIGLSNGLRHFQQMLGFRIHRVRLERRGPP